MSRDRVSKKIAILRREGVPERQAVAEALSMERAGRIGPHGGYRRARRKSSRRSKRRSARR